MRNFVVSEDGISVVIRTFNSAKTLNKVITGLDLEKSDEVIVVDSGSTDTTLQIALQLGARIVCAPGPFNYSKSLNLGFQKAQNPWVLVISSHSIPIVTAFLKTYRKEICQFPDNIVVGYGPSTLSGKSHSIVDSQKTTFFSPNEYGVVEGVCGNGNTIYRYNAWIQLPFDENIRTAEDKFWIMEMLKRNYRFAYLPMVPTQNQNQASLAYMFRKGYSDARAMRTESHKPMSIYHFGGALKNMAKDWIKGDISWKNWARYSAHICGQFVASYQSQDNTPFTP